MAIEGMTLNDLRIIEGDKGRVMHALKSTDTSFAGFGEAYFSSVDYNAVKGWKRHSRMVLNLVVVSGSIRFVVVDDRGASPIFEEVTLGPEVNYQRLTVQPGLWVAFQGKYEGLNLLLNLASIPHDPTEADNMAIEDAGFAFDFEA
jgi:dTDP-4-dehydrorhamnose 3,5-epimerase